MRPAIKVAAGRARALGSDLRRSLAEAIGALSFTGVIFFVQVARVRAGADPALLEMPAMMRTGGIWPYSLSQAFGWTALSWAWVTILLGVSLPAWGWRPQRREIVERLHRTTSITLIGLMIAHAFTLIWDRMGDTLVSVFVPWMTSYAPGLFPQTLGILSFYLAVLLGLSFYARDRIGPRAWRWLHRYFVPAVYVLAVWHTFLYGSDLSSHNRLWWLVWLLQVPLLAAFAARLRAGRGRLRS